MLGASWLLTVERFIMATLVLYSQGKWYAVQVTKQLTRNFHFYVLANMGVESDITFLPCGCCFFLKVLCAGTSACQSVSEHCLWQDDNVEETLNCYLYFVSAMSYKHISDLDTELNLECCKCSEVVCTLLGAVQSFVDMCSCNPLPTRGVSALD